jgi:hypothetical protein
MKRPGPAIPDGAFGTPKTELKQVNNLQGKPLVDQIKSRMQQRDVKPPHWNKYAQDVIDTNGYPSKTFAQYAEEAGVKTNQTGILKKAPITNLPGFGIENNNSMGNETGMPIAGGGGPQLIRPKVEVEKSSNPIMQGFQESDIFKNMMGRPMTMDVQNYTFDGKEMSGSGTYFGGLRRYLESIGKGDLLQSNNSGLGGLQTVQPGEGGRLGIAGQSPLMQAAMANGGRAGFMAGGMGRRGFLKMLAGLGAGIGAVKSGIIGLGGKQAGKEVAKEIVQQSTTAPPPYFFKLADKIRTLGDDITDIAATTDREVVKKYKGFEMSEDVTTGDIVIKKRNEGVFYDQDGIISDEYIVYKPGQADEVTKMKTVDEYDEYTIRPDSDGKLTDAEDGLDSIDEILQEVGDQVAPIKNQTMNQTKSIKKASGGIARMLGE